LHVHRCAIVVLIIMFSGSADYSDRKGVFCVDDPFQGIVLFRADSDARVRTFEIKLTRPSTRPRQFCFADDCSLVISSSDHGLMYVFDRRTGEVTDSLRVDANDWVQSVTVRFHAKIKCSN
jgi:6-phosphogluconolactonase (cycloisomerase 2 family)